MDLILQSEQLGNVTLDKKLELCTLVDTCLRKSVDNVWVGWVHRTELVVENWERNLLRKGVAIGLIRPLSKFL